MISIEMLRFSTHHRNGTSIVASQSRSSSRRSEPSLHDAIWISKRQRAGDCRPLPLPWFDQTELLKRQPRLLHRNILSSCWSTAARIVVVAERLNGAAGSGSEPSTVIGQRGACD